VREIPVLPRQLSIPSFESRLIVKAKRTSQSDEEDSLVREVDELWERLKFKPLHVCQICSALNVPPRTLQRVFHRAVGMGPAHYLTAKRLAKARKALLAGDPAKTSVTKVACDQGFYELGRFAVIYRRMFGERPSQTLRRRLRRRAEVME
jgi:transcriptional regulator GlxA family with amidase domain